MLKINNLKYKHPDNQNIYTYNLQVSQKEIIAIVGQSGSGKSTLLDLISGFLNPISGELYFNNIKLNNLDISKRPITILFQNNNLFEHLSVKKNILLGTNKKDIDIYNILKDIKLEEFEDKIVSTLSGGQKQRVALARVLLRDKPILLLDEPFSALDKSTKLQMLNLVKSITNKYNLHTIMITHDIFDCEQIANKTYTMQDNKLVILW